jgi:hypothetical protein
MPDLISKDEDILMSPSIVGYKLLKMMHKKGVSKISIFDVADHFKNEKWFSPKNLYFAMLFLYSLDLIGFNNSYIFKVENAA